jgi:hypothetical protein
VVETWWLRYTFTLNWKVVQPGVVTFARGESLGQLVPVPHGTFLGAVAVEEPVSGRPEVEAELLRWQEERQRRAAERFASHQLYRKAEGIPEHLSRVPVPPLSRADQAPDVPGTP